MVCEDRSCEVCLNKIRSGKYVRIDVLEFTVEGKALGGTTTYEHSDCHYKKTTPTPASSTPTTPKKLHLTISIDDLKSDFPAIENIRHHNAHGQSLDFEVVWKKDKETPHGQDQNI